MVCLLVLARSAHGYDADALAAFGCNRRPMPAVDHPEHDVAHIVVSGIRGGQRHWRRRAGRQDRGLPRTTIRVFDSRLRISHIQIIFYVWIKDMCNNIMVCKFLIQDLKVSLCIANLVHMTAVMVSPALKAQKQELSLQDRVTYNMKVLIAIRQTSQKDLAQAMGIAAPTLSQKFSGRTRWNMDDIEKASDFLDVKPEALVAGHGFEPWTSGL